MELLDLARETGESAVRHLADSAREEVRRRVRHALGVRGTPPSTCVDPGLAYLPVDGAARAIHGDLPSMLVGGIASLLLQMLHPLTMTGVAQHSRYREDPLGRLARTAHFVGTTTFGSRTDADAAISRVRAVHAAVTGVSTRGVPYRASDPHLLEWVHVAELSMFLAAARTYGSRTVTGQLADRYVAEMVRLGHDLGAEDLPENEAMLHERLEAFRPELELIDEALAARDFVLRGVQRRPDRAAAYLTLSAAAVGILPEWARRELRIPSPPLADSIIVRPAATLLTSALRFAISPVR